ncbi:chemerin-like receptor 1 [Symphorus nematophorus]
MNTTPSYHRNTTDVTGNNGSDYFDQYNHLRKALHIFSLVVYSLVFVLGVLGNGVVIWVTGFKMKKTVNTVWYLSLALADFLFAACLPLTITYLALGFHWPFGKFLCKMNNTLIILNLYASVYMLMVISVDRCVSVVWPVWAQNHRSVRKASFVSLCVWVLALILSPPYFIFRDTVDDENYTVCFYNYSLSNDYETPSVIALGQLRHQAMAITHSILGFVVPFTVIVSCYAVIIRRVRSNRTLASQSSRPFKIIAAVIITFFLCWAPFHIIRLIDLAHHTAAVKSQKLSFVIAVGFPIANSLTFINSCLNPLLYVFMGQDFKDEVRKSILKVLEAAFQEDTPGSHIDSKSTEISQSNDRSILNTAV